MDVKQLTIGQVIDFINGVQSCDALPEEASRKAGLASEFVGKHCIARGTGSGVHMGDVAAVEGTAVVLKDARRIWAWKGAFTLSEVANRGVAADSRISEVVPSIYLSTVWELIPTTQQARKTFDEIHEQD